MANEKRDTNRARERKHDCAEHVENILDEVETEARDRKYPVRSEELATEYADRPIDMPNETESIGSVFDRLDEEYDSPAAIREALRGELADDHGERREDRERDRSDEPSGSETA